MEEAPENGKESQHSVHANGLIDKYELLYVQLQAICLNEAVQENL
jgi:hypothetical protein